MSIFVEREIFQQDKFPNLEDIQKEKNRIIIEINNMENKILETTLILETTNNFDNDDNFRKLKLSYDWILNELNNAKSLFSNSDSSKKKKILENHINNLNCNLESYGKQLDEYKEKNKLNVNTKLFSELEDLNTKLLYFKELLSKLEIKIEWYYNLCYLLQITKIKIDDILSPKLS